jgi:hypothetical protein
VAALMELTSLPVWLLVVGALAVALAVAGASRLVIGALVPTAERDHVQAIAAPLMPALGATFAVLTALTLSSEAGYLRSADEIVSREASEASRLAWASTSPRVDTPPIQEALADYLRSTRRDEWEGSVDAESTPTTEAIAALERAVRAEAARSELGTPASTELLASLDAVVGARRARLAAADRDLPGLYVITLVISGVALIANAGALAFRSSVRTSLLVAGLACVVGLSLALLFAIAAPWDGGLVATGEPIDAVVRDLQAGFFSA